MAKQEAFLQFLKAARSLADQGLSKEAIVQFARNEFGEISELFKKQIDSLFKPKKGIENIKIKDEVFDDTVVKLPVDDRGVPFNPSNPLKDYSKELTDSPLDDLKKIVDDFKPIKPPKPKKSRMLDDDEYQDFLDEVGGADQLEAYNFDGTVGDAKRILKEQKKYMNDMFMEYKKGNLNPKPGEVNREKFLRGKFEEMEASGDSKLMTREEIEELSSFDLQKDMDKSIKKFKEKDAKQKKIIKDFDPGDRDPNAEGGRAGFYTGGITDVEPSLDDIGHGADALNARTRLMSPGNQATTSTGLNYLLAEDNDNMRIPFKEKGKVSLLDLIKVNASGSKSGRQQIQGAPKGITVDKETINAIVNLDIPINEKMNIIGSYAYGKGRNKIEDKEQEIFLDEGGYKDRNIGLGFNQDGEGLSGSIMRNLETGDDDFKIRISKKFAEGGRIGFANGNGVADEDAEKAALGKRVRELMDEGFDMGEAVKKAMSEGYAEGGRIGFSKGKAVGKGLDYLMDLFKPKPKVIFDEKRFREGPIDLDFLENIDKKDLEPFIRSRDTMGPGGYGMYDDFADMPSGLQAAELISRIKGPRNTINYEAAEMFIGKKLKGNESVNELIEMLVEKKAEGGRIGFSKGKLADAARRKFMKSAAGIGAGIAGIKTGILGFGEKAAPVVEKAVEAAKGVPPYFYQLVDIIKSKGREIKSYGDRIKQYLAPSKDGKSELMLTEDLNTGDIQVKKIFKENDDMVTKTEEMNFNKGQGDEATKGTSADNYEEVTSYNSRIYKDEFNDPDYVDGIDVESITKEIVEKKADGGRIGFSKGKAVLKGLDYLKELFKKKDYLEEFPRIDIKELMKGDKPIKLYSGVGDRQANTLKAYKEDAKFFNTTVDKIKKDNFKGQWFTPFKEYASGFGNASNINAKMLTTELTPKEIKMAKRYVDKVNTKDKMISMMKMKGMDNPPKYRITTDDNTVIIPRIKLKKLKEEGKINTDYMVLDKIKSKLGLAEGGVAGILGE